MTCAHVVNVAIKKVPGVESVEVSLNQGSAKVKLKPDNAVRPEELWNLLRDNGYKPKDTRVVVRGRVVASGGKIHLDVSGANHSYELTPEPGAPGAYDELKAKAGEAVAVDGVMTPPNQKNGTAP